MSAITKQTMIPLGSALSVILVVVGCTAWVVRTVETLSFRVAAVEAMMDDRYTKTAAAEVTLRNALLNPQMRFSDPRDPSQFITATSAVRPAEVQR